MMDFIDELFEDKKEDNGYEILKCLIEKDIEYLYPDDKGDILEKELATILRG